jgi:hypothetical protein
MAQYSSLLGTYIEVIYHFWDLNLRASGKLLSDSGSFIIVLQDGDQDGCNPVFQLKLPYDCITKIERSFSNE